MPQPFVPRENIDFVITALHGFFHWESTGRIFGDAFCNEAGFTSPSDAVADAIAELSGATDLDLTLTPEEQSELAEKSLLLYDSDVQDIQANVQCLPQRYRDRSFYAQLMAMELNSPNTYKPACFRSTSLPDPLLAICLASVT